MAVKNSSSEIDRGDRFAFGKNWSQFLKVLDENRIREAEKSLQTMLELERLDHLTFLDVGCGSGLFSLAAWRLGAKVFSFDFDSQSVSTAKELRHRYCNNQNLWQIDTASALDKNYLKKIGFFDIVYSWGVLHHTGNMWQSMDNISSLVAPSGRLFIALYNDQGRISNFWRRVKRLYCSGTLGQIIVKTSFFPIFALSGLVSDILKGNNPLLRYKEYRKKRGMSLTHDWIDWFGGYPFETAKPEDVFDFYLQREFTMIKLTTRQSLGCNQFVFSRSWSPQDTATRTNQLIPDE